MPRGWLHRDPSWWCSWWLYLQATHLLAVPTGAHSKGRAPVLDLPQSPPSTEHRNSVCPGPLNPTAD